MRVLVINCGSSTIKYAVLDPVQSEYGVRGVAARIGEPGGPPDHATALRQLLESVDLDGVAAVGHRIVHGGRFALPMLVDNGVLAELRQLIPLAPLHNPAGIAGIDAARALRPDLPQVAVFDTGFHYAMPDAASTYAIDRSLATKHRIRRYGFHGISFAYVSRQAARLLNRPLTTLNMIVLHLGNGASAAAIDSGVSMATSMGFTPLEGLVMGTRPGDLDPGVVLYLQRTLGLSLDEVDELLNHHSGLYGMAGASDMRTVLERRAAGDREARLAFDVYCHRVRQYVGAYHAVLGRLDAIVFTAGVGENAPAVRDVSLIGLQHWGITVDPARNEGNGKGARIISPPGTPVTVCVVPTDEEIAIAHEVVGLLSGQAAGAAS